ncbi:hypothetical protein TVAG_062280 [Trichomonas vaginalis G3]|uniref:Uncharacterized protein n=1 Tax=Trichomonas vaginalis (strain ATCC PRA-98 / G3) TaxID=412133 RepID=A2G421_TRIV3|nr:nucleolar complex 2 and RAD4-related family [Trichomonas vaginalis G3]EAX88104.1 hypothetical protein TVAG_062280 [Trichomonas vaginalis G3]KAI5547724.1 nucleolar complex 2 and RAD4-related family [Trichomonas vaginalis G3]|eukprot:XP_001301034.1 hypothetical protein [Trichomonas vaginalis G3]
MSSTKGKDLPQVSDEEFPEPEDSDANPEEEEEEQQKEIVVIDDELIEELKQAIPKGNPVQLAQAVDVIMGALELKENVIFEEEHKLNPLTEILVPLVSKVYSIYEANPTGKKHQITEKMLADIVQTYESFEKFKGSAELLEAFFETVLITRKFVDKIDISKALTTAVKFGISNPKYSEITNKELQKICDDTTFLPIVFNLRYDEYKNLADKQHTESIERLLPELIAFFTEKGEISKSFVKKLIKNLASRICDDIVKKDKGIISWGTVAEMNFITEFILKTEDQRFVYPYLTELYSFLRNFPTANYLPFQLRAAQNIAQICSKFSKISPLLAWSADSMAIICSLHCKGKGGRFDWDNELVAPQNVNYEYAEEAFDRLSRIIHAQLVEFSENIAFPEYSQFIKRRLEEITINAKNDRLKYRPKALIKTISEQQDALISIKNNLQWKDRKEQIAAWAPAMEEMPTPIKTSAERSKKVEEAIRKANAANRQNNEAVVDATGDRVERVNADNFLD